MRTTDGGWVRGVRALVAAGAVTALMPLVAFAQLAPVAGAHYDFSAMSGYEGGADVGGDFAASVPLELPAARGGMAVPVQVVYGGKRFGAAGLGWDVPLSFITRSAGTAKRRPAPQAFSLDQPPALATPERWSLTLAGSVIDLVRNEANTAWVGRRGNTQMEVRQNGDGLMVAYDGEGNTYNFSSRGATAGSRLANGDLYVLTSIVGANSSNRIELGYAFNAPSLPGGGTGLAINLMTVSYNQGSGTANCYKHKVSLLYDTPATAPLSMSVFNGTVLARMQKLSSIVTKSRETCALEKTLSTYTFAYQADVDTQQPQLRSVTMTGQQGTPEQNVTLPIATYSYGSIVDPVTQKITYQKVQNAGPASASEEHYAYGIGYTKATTINNGGVIPDSRNLETYQSLVDFNGDGRPDFIDQALHLYLNVAGASGPTQLINQGTTVPRFPKMRSWEVSQRFRPNSRTDTYTQYVDMNGDGRIDVVDAGTDPTHWLVYLNKPDPADRSKSIYPVIKISTARVRQALAGTGINATEPVPLARYTSVPENAYGVCWTNHLVNGTVRWLYTSTGTDGAGCTGAPAITPRKRTITEFELKDINGDGYPDFVYNASYVNVSTLHVPPEPSYPPPPPLDFRHVLSTLPSDLSGSRDVKALINTAGVHLIDEDPLFSSPVLVESGGTTGCGVGRWEVDPASTAAGGMIAQTCALQDINGDGIADRVTTANGVTTAKLGTGNMSQPYLGTVITLPGPLARSLTDMQLDPALPGQAKPLACGVSSTFDTLGIAGLRDLTGDGIPDYVSVAGFYTSVAVGTGTGFAPAKKIEANDANGLLSSLSVERNQCEVSTQPGAQIAGATTKGLYDLDGDGQPEFIDMKATSWEIYQLKPPVAQVDVGGGIASVPAAGRLIRIDTGYGASTTIGYRSAKEEWNAAHHVPFPEIVVESVGTKDAANTSLLATLRYAYRGAEMIFDPAYDAFRFPGYRRSVALTHDNGKGTATITDSYGLEPYVAGMSATERFGRYLKAGLTRDITTVTLSGVNANNPWDVLNLNIDNDVRRISGTHYDWDVRSLPASATATGNERCLDMVYPYDFAASQAANAQWPNQDVCTQHGFVFQSNTFAWRGIPGSDDALSSTATVQTNVQVKAVDDWGRVTQVYNDNDLNSAQDDDQCVEITYANPDPAVTARVLNAPSLRVTKKCEGAGQPSTVVLAKEAYLYDNAPAGTVSRGQLTAHSVWRLNSETGEAVGSGPSEIRTFEGTYDVATGNLLTRTMPRDDGAKRTVTTSYDPFGLVVVGEETRATRGDGSLLPVLNTTMTVDAVTLKTLSTTDANGTKSGATYDGFGREVLSTLAPAGGGSEEVMSKTTYAGFAIGQSGGRRITSKKFTNPVAVANVDTAPGRSSVVFLDSLGRTQRGEVALGADYANQTLVVGQRNYDAYGRVRFVADPFPLGQALVAPYGTTYHFRDDGTPQCTYRAYGEQAFAENPETDEASERLVTCVTHSFKARQEVFSTFGADAKLTSSPQAHMAREQTYSAIGRLLQDRTVDRASDTPFAESMSYSYDRFGHMTHMTRLGVEQDVELQTRWHYDSLGQVIQFTEPNMPSQFRRYDSWGELIATEWCDPAGASCGPGTFNRGLYNQYDAFGRRLHSEERSNNAVLPETVQDFVYDQGVNTTTPPVTATYVLGRLAKATAPTSSVSYSYDGFGRTQTEVHTDLTVPANSPARVFVQKQDFNGDGSLKALHLLLPDATFRDEKADYAYDSAGRLRSVKYSDGVLTKDLFTANGIGDIDLFGRLRAAKYGANTYTANYADGGRRLLNSMKVTAPTSPATSREFVFAGTNGALPAFDPVGRERSRKEIKNGDPNTPTLTSTYDALGRLSRASRIASSGASLEQRDYQYDTLGNIVSHAGADAVTLSYDNVDDDRVCSIGFNGVAPNPVCNVKYDAVGNIVEMPTRNNGTRTLSYFPSGRTKRIVQGGTVATYDYDAFGDVQRLTLDSLSATDTRKDKHFGRLIYQREELVGSTRTPVNNRSFPGPGGFIATRHGAATDAPWTFTFGEQRGNRFFTDQNGAFVQDVDYKPYGEAKAPANMLPGSQPGSPLYTNAQWNGGDALAALGVSQLGARIYDPVIGRFLSRDPLIIPRTATKTNPYAFAMNDPINRADPTGLDAEGPETGHKPKQCEGDCGRNDGKTEVIRISSPGPAPPSPGKKKIVAGGHQTPGANPTRSGAGGGTGPKVKSVCDNGGCNLPTTIGGLDQWDLERIAEQALNRLLQERWEETAEGQEELRQEREEAAEEADKEAYERELRRANQPTIDELTLEILRSNPPCDGCVPLLPPRRR